MKGEQATLNEDKLVFEYSGKIFTLRGDVSKVITDYIFIKADSTDAKLSSDFMEVHFDIHSRIKSLRDSNFFKRHFKKRALLAYG